MSKNFSCNKCTNQSEQDNIFCNECKDEDRVRDFAQRIGMDALDTSIQEGAFLAKHIEKCQKCSDLLNLCNEKISHHAREDWT